MIGTTSTRDRRLGIPLLSPRELPGWLAQDAPDIPTALVFGPEVGGLTNEELALASAVVTIPCSPVQPTLNLAQAVLILAYELFLARGGRGRADRRPRSRRPAAAEIDGLLEHAAQVLQEVGFARDDSFRGCCATSAASPPAPRRTAGTCGSCGASAGGWRGC